MPHRIHCTDAVGPLLQMSHVAWSVCLSACLCACACVGHTNVLRKNSWTDRDAVWGRGRLVWVQGAIIRWGAELISPRKGATLEVVRLIEIEKHWKSLLQCAQQKGSSSLQWRHDCCSQMQCSGLSHFHKHYKQGVALTRRNRTGPPCSVVHPTAHAPGRRRTDHPRARRSAGRPARRQRYRLQTSACKAILAH